MLHPCLHRKAVKATLVLLPLLGITYMLFFVNPGEDDISQIVFIYFNSFLQSFQVRLWVMMQCDTGQCSPAHAHCIQSESCCISWCVLSRSLTSGGIFRLWAFFKGRWFEVAFWLCAHTIWSSCLLFCTHSWQDYRGLVGLISPLWPFFFFFIFVSSVLELLDWVGG